MSEIARGFDTLVYACAVCLALAGTGSRAEGQTSKDEAPRGSLTKEVIRRTIGRGSAQIRQCAEQTPRNLQNGKGPQITVRFVIGADGSVREAVVLESKLNDPRTDNCVLSVFKNLRFPAPKGGGIVEVTYPLWFDFAGG